MFTIRKSNQNSFFPFLNAQSTCIHSSAAKSLTKRLIDILGAAVGLSITLLLLPPIAIAIYIDNRGPILYSQIRCGYRGRRFRMWKFRSMVANADQLKHHISNQSMGHIFKNLSDPRVTRVGQFLRKTSLDELPQFWNVLWGEMSLVGTRPPLPDEVRLYNARHWRRLDVKPGITGIWQVNGRSLISDFETIVDMDLYYCQRWSIAYDLWLICKTIAVVCLRTGAF